MSTARDEELGLALRNLPVPREDPGFWADVQTGLTMAAAEEPPENLRSMKATDMPTDHSERPQPLELVRPQEYRERPSWLVAVAASILLVVGVFVYQALANNDGSPGMVDSTNSDGVLVADDPAVPTTAKEAAPEETTSVPAQSAIDEQVLGQLAYPSDWDPGVESIQLSDGVWEGEPADGPGSTFPVVTLANHVVDPETGTAAGVVLAGDGGGSGTFYELYLVSLQTDGSLHVSQPVTLGDRVEFSRFTFDGSSISVVYTDWFDEEFDQAYQITDGELRLLSNG